MAPASIQSAAWAWVSSPFGLVAVAVVAAVGQSEQHHTYCAITQSATCWSWLGLTLPRCLQVKAAELHRCANR